MLPYVLGFAGALLVDTIPVFAPPAWVILLALALEFEDASPMALAVIGAAGSTIGRYILSLYMPRLAHRLLDRRENQNIKYLGTRIGGRFWPAFFFVLVYSHTPLSTTALFTAVGAARVNPAPILPAFWIGKAVTDAVMIYWGMKATRSAADLWKGQASPQSAIPIVLGLAAVALMLFVDWRQLLEKRRLRLRFDILKD